jgi:Ca-activated chloride channel homolog
MSFLSPLGLALAGLLLPLVFLYLLRVQRREQRVSSLLLWASSMRDQQATAFLGRLRRDPLLILQILALLLLALALARPVVPVMGEGERKVVVVLDGSASMKATDVSPSRFEAARSEATRLVRGLGPGAEVMVIEAGTQPQVLAPLTRDRDAALAALRRAQARDVPTRLVDGLRIARALLGEDQRGEIHVFTDGAFTLDETADTTDPRLRWTAVGRRGHNAAVTALSVRKSYRGPSDYEAFVTLANHAAEPLPAGLVLEIDGRRLAERSTDLAPGVRR